MHFGLISLKGKNIHEPTETLTENSDEYVGGLSWENILLTAEILARSLVKFYCHEFIINAMRQRASADNLTLCYRKKKTNWCQFLMRLAGLLTMNFVITLSK